MLYGRIGAIGGKIERPYALLADPTTEIIILADILANVRMQFYLFIMGNEINRDSVVYFDRAAASPRVIGDIRI